MILLKKEPVLFQTVANGVCLPIISLMKLSALQGCPVQIKTDGADTLVFNQKDIAVKVFGPLKRSLQCKMEALGELSVFFENEEGASQKASDLTSPYLMFVMAICC